MVDVLSSSLYVVVVLTMMYVLYFCNNIIINLFSTKVPYYMEHYFYELILAQWCIISLIINYALLH